MYFTNEHANEMTVEHKRGTRHGRGVPRQHFSLEMRSFICAHMKRSDPVTRRFIQYAVMASTSMNILVRDGKTGKVITEPSHNELWLVRQRSGFGRAARTPWKIIREVNEQVFEEMEQHRKWHFGFDDYYDLYIWDREAGAPFACLYENISRVSLVQDSTNICSVLTFL
jgi:hypothetical protein